MRLRAQDPQYRANVAAGVRRSKQRMTAEERSEAARKTHTPESDQQRREAMQQKWEDREYRERRAATEALPETKERRSIAATEANNRPGRREHQSRIMREKFLHDDVFRERHAVAMQRAAVNPAYRHVRSAGMKRVWETRPELFTDSLNALQIDAQSVAGRERRRRVLKQLWEDPEFIRRTMLAIAARPISKYERRVIDQLDEWDVTYVPHLNIYRYELDIYVPELHLDIEVDGWHHSLPGHPEHDAYRDAALNALNIRVARVNEKLIDQGWLVTWLREQLQ